jgi:hypothetical protein
MEITKPLKKLSKNGHSEMVNDAPRPEFSGLFFIPPKSTSIKESTSINLSKSK